LRLGARAATFEAMIPRLRPAAALAAVFALLVAWTVGPWVAACASMPAVEEAAAAMHSGHGAHAGPGSHPERGRHGGAPTHHQPSPDDDGGAPPCPMLAGGPSCTGPLATAPAATLAIGAGDAADGFAPPAEVRPPLLSASLFRPPKLG
jgi:hypothetical protein